MLYIEMNQKGMLKVFEVGVPAISKHLKNIFEEKELEENMVVSKMENTTIHGAIEGKMQTTAFQMKKIRLLRSTSQSKRVREKKN